MNFVFQVSQCRGRPRQICKSCNDVNDTFKMLWEGWGGGDESNRHGVKILAGKLVVRCVHTVDVADGAQSFQSIFVEIGGRVTLCICG